MASLTPASLTILRTSITPSLRSLGGGPNLGAPYILYLPADDTFCLHYEGSPQCKSDDPALLGEMMRRERAEPGFISRALSPSYDPETALLPGDLLAARARTREASAARSAAEREAAEDAAWKRRRFQQIDPASISLEELFDDE